MIIRVDPSAALPVYEQIREQVVRMAVTGSLPAGSRLPTIRQLATDLGLAKGTVARAYELLETDSVVQTLGRKGTFIAEQRLQPSKDADDQLRDAAEVYLITVRQLGLEISDAKNVLDRVWRDL